VVAAGKAGFAAALAQGSHMLAAGQCPDGTSDVEHVLLVGTDSLLDSCTIEHLLEQERLLVPGNREGFVPGEAAAALLLTAAGASGLEISGVGVGKEAAQPGLELPNRFEGLTAAVRMACTSASIDPLELEFRLSDQNGEGFFASEAANAFTRVMFGGTGKLAHLTISDKLGEIGAATGPAGVAYLWKLMTSTTRAPGRLGVVHLANDDGLRSAVVVRHR
jgi:3-oxoacyl-[acyl-carrier-protein] synthase-1